MYLTLLIDEEGKCDKCSETRSKQTRIELKLTCACVVISEYVKETKFLLLALITENNKQ